VLGGRHVADDAHVDAAVPVDLDRTQELEVAVAARGEAQDVLMGDQRARRAVGQLRVQQQLLQVVL